MKKKRWTARTAPVMGLLFCLLLWSGAGCAAGTGETAGMNPIPLSSRVRNSEDVVRAIRHGLRGRAKSITVSFDYGSDIFDEVNSVVDDWMELALAETKDPAEGDYIRYQYGGYTLNSAKTNDGDRIRYTLTITPEYYSWLYQEEEVDREVGRLMGEWFPAEENSTHNLEAEFTRTIYDYLCRTVRYDEIHRKNPHYHEKSTAYAALVRHTATCQGYCTALYRLLREAGVDCRIVTGEAVREDGQKGEDLHAWVIACIDGRYYNLDPTWDAGRTEEEWQYFLKGERDFPGHTPGERFQTEEFRSRHPMAAGEYVE